MDIKPIKTKVDYDEAMKLLESLVILEPIEGSEDSDRLMVLSALIEDYENATFPDRQVDPVEAIRFRMDQMGLRPTDLAPYLGGKSRVSEILSGKRALTVKMVKNLEEGLGIPASSLIGSAGANASKRWTPKTISLMADRGYFSDDYSGNDVGEIISSGILRKFLSSMPVQQFALLRRTNYRDSNSIDKQLLNAWLAKISLDAKKVIDSDDVPIFSKESITMEWIQMLTKLSVKPEGPIEAVSLLKARGVVVVVEPELPNTQLDGAAIILNSRAVIGLTLRHDRLDNFWFSLIHEIAHIKLHSHADEIFFDNLDSNPELINDIESEADIFARDAMIPKDIWDRSPIRRNASPMIIKSFADKIGVSEAIVAGRLRYESGHWYKYTNIIRSTPVRQFFGGKTW